MRTMQGSARHGGALHSKAMPCRGKVGQGTARQGKAILGLLLFSAIAAAQEPVIIPTSAPLELRSALAMHTPYIVVPAGQYVFDGGIEIPSGTVVCWAPGSTIKFQISERPQECTEESPAVIVAAVKFGAGVDWIAHGSTFSVQWTGEGSPPAPTSLGIHLLYGRGVDGVRIRGGEYRETPGDGVYIGPGPNREPCTDWQIDDITADANWRQGLSITSANGVLVRNS